MHIAKRRDTGGERVFQIGQKVRIIRAAGDSHMLGAITTVVSPLKQVTWSDNTRGLGHDIEIIDPRFPEHIVNAPPSWLEPVDDGCDSIAWTESLRNLCGIGTKQKESA